MASATMDSAAPSYAAVAATTPPPEEETALAIKDTITLQHDDTNPDDEIVTTPGEYNGQGMDVSPKAAVRRAKVTHRGPWSSLKSSSPKEAKGAKTKETTVYQNTNGVNGSSLTSVKTPDDYHESLELDKRQRRKDSDQSLELVSGRQPSAGWETSG
jgi:hypothetical protein